MSNTQKFPHLNQSIENQKLCNVSKNQPPKSIRRRDMWSVLHFILEKVLLISYLSSKLSQEVEISDVCIH